MKQYRVIVHKNFGPFVFVFDKYEDAVKCVKDKWFSSGVWDIALFEDGKQLDIRELMKAWGNRPIYC